MTFGEKLRSLRISKGMSLKELSEKTGLTSPRLSNYEHNVMIPRATAIGKLAKALECNVSDLL